MSDSKTSEKKLINVNSKHRVNGTTTNFDVYVGSHVSNTQSIGIHSIELVNSFYNLHRNNNTLTVYVASLLNPPSIMDASPVGSFDITLATQNYNVAAFTTALQDALNAGIQSIPSLTSVPGINTIFNVNFHSNSFKLTISMSSSINNLAFSFYPSSGTSTDKLLNVMGFLLKRNSQLINLYNRSLTSTSLVDLRGPSCIYVWSSIAPNVGVDSNGNMLQLLAKLQVDKPVGSTIFYKSNDPDLDRFNVNSRNIDVIRFYLRDEDGIELDNNNMEWSLSLIAYS